MSRNQETANLKSYMIYDENSSSTETKLAIVIGFGGSLVQVSSQKIPIIFYLCKYTTMGVHKKLFFACLSAYDYFVLPTAVCACVNEELGNSTVTTNYF